MAKYLGIDIGSTYVRAVSLRTSYRRVAIEAMNEVPRSAAPTLAEVIRMAAGALVVPGEPVAVNLEGDRTYLRRIAIPEAAQKQLTEVLPFELESELPFELEGAVYDHAVLRRIPDDPNVPVLAVVAKTEDVRQRIQLIRDSIADEPERVAPGGLSLSSLASLVPDLSLPGPTAIFDLEESRSEVIILDRGEPVFARTISRGTAGLPGSAALLSREFRQSLAAWRLVGELPKVAYLVGGGSTAPGALEFFQGELGMPVLPLPPPRFEETADALLAQVTTFAKAVSLALALLNRGRGFNLRRGELAYERGFGFLREKIPLLSGLGAVIVFSFLFATWADLRALGQERTTLETSLSAVTTDVFGEATTDPQRAADLLDRSTSTVDEDPLPHADAFDVMVQLAQAVPDGMNHDIEELDVQRGHVSIHGIVPSIPDAQQIATTLKAVRCFQDVKIVRTNQELGSDRQKYAMEFDIKCPAEGKEKSGGAPSASASAGVSGGAKP